MADKLSEDEIQQRLGELDGWSVEDGKLHREFKFRDFNEAFGFMTRLALVAEKMNHHPDWSNSWNAVVVDIVNHAAGGISSACFDLATKANELAGS